MAKAASAAPTLEHYIWSTLPKGSEKYPVYHFESQKEVDEIIKKNRALLKKTTFLLISWYGNNLHMASYRPYWIGTVKKYVQFTTYGADVSIPLIGNVGNVTPFVKAIVENPEKTQDGAIVVGSIGYWTAKEWVEAWAAGRGAEVQMMRVSPEDYAALFPWPRWSEECALMMDYFEHVPLPKWFAPGSNILMA